MAKTGIHIKRANIGAVEAHNERSKEYLEALAKAKRPLYFFPDLTSNNSSWVNPRYQGKTCRELFDERLTLYGKKHHTKDGKPKKPILEDRKRVNKKTGKEYTVAGWSPIREGCPPIKEDTTFEDFKPVIDWARENGLDVIRIDLHHDEGHEEETIDKVTKGKKTERKLNRHAHVVFDWINPKTGETIKLNDAKMSELQTVLADALGMERGESKEITGVKYISHAEYREKKAEESAIRLEEGNNSLRETNITLRNNNKRLSQENASLRAENESLSIRLKEAMNQYKSASDFLAKVQKLLGPDLGTPPSHPSTQEERQSFYETIPSLPIGIWISDVKIPQSQSHSNTYVISGKINGYPTESRELSYDEARDVGRRGVPAIVSHETMFIYKFYDLIRNIAFAIWNNLMNLSNDMKQNRSQRLD